MRRLGVWGIAVAVLVGLGAAAVAWAEEPDAGAKAGWFGGGWFGSKPAAAKSDKPKAEKPKAEKAKGEAAAKAPPVVDAAAEARSREEEAYFRRLAVCDKLQQIADSTNDTELQGLALQLSERVYAVYMQRIAHLPASRAEFDLDEYLLDKNRRGGATAPAALPHTVPGKDGGEGEDQP